MLKRKDGFSTIIAMILILTVLPLMFFAVVDIPYWMVANRRLQNIVDNAASGASTMLVESSLADGIIEFDTVAAEVVILSEIHDYFELNSIPEILAGGYTQLTLKEGSRSYFQMDPIIMKLAPNTHTNINDIPYGTPIIEYVIFNPKDNPQAVTYELTSGQTITVYRPTIIISITTKVYAPSKLLPLTMHKIAIQEVSLGQNQ